MAHFMPKPSAYCEWLTEFLGPQGRDRKDALRFIIETLARNDNALRHTMERSYALPQELLGLTPQKGSYGANQHRRGRRGGQPSQQRPRCALVIALGLVLGGYELRHHRSPHLAQASRIPPTSPATSAHLASWGYELSEIEQTIVDAKDAS